MPEVLKVITFISLGFIFLLIELFTPGFGLCGICGILFIIFGCYSAFVKLNLFWGVFTALLSLLVVCGFFKIFSRSAIWKKMRLVSKETKEEGFTSSQDLSSLLNKNGITMSALRPSGVALIEGRRIDVIAEGLFIEQDKKIKVVRIEGNKVTVKEET